jgi:two-component system NtrC family sensor kinase
MASLLAHEINNPLAALTNVMFLLEQQPLESHIREYVSMATDALTRINRIAGMTMGFYFEKDAPATLHICQIIDEVAEVLISKESFKNMQLVRDFKCDATVVASLPRIRQLMINLLTNAVESGAQAVRVRVRAGWDWRQHGGTGVRITIADDGGGIRHELHKKVFEPFFSTKPDKGAGLGLWAARAVVLRNEGRIRLRSTATGPRRGTCVHVFLPAEVDTKVFNVDSSA